MIVSGLNVMVFPLGAIKIFANGVTGSGEGFGKALSDFDSSLKEKIRSRAQKELRLAGYGKP